MTQFRELISLISESGEVAGFPVFYRCCAPNLPIGDGFAGHDEERGLGTTRVDL